MVSQQVWKYSLEKGRYDISIPCFLSDGWQFRCFSMHVSCVRSTCNLWHFLFLGRALHTWDQKNLLYRISLPHVGMAKHIYIYTRTNIWKQVTMPMEVSWDNFQTAAWENEILFVDFKSRNMWNRSAPCRTRKTCKQGHIFHMTRQVKVRRAERLAAPKSSKKKIKSTIKAPQQPHPGQVWNGKCSTVQCHWLGWTADRPASKRDWCPQVPKGWQLSYTHDLRPRRGTKLPPLRLHHALLPQPSPLTRTVGQVPKVHHEHGQHFPKCRAQLQSLHGEQLLH